jgi:hypothetical protein
MMTEFVAGMYDVMRGRRHVTAGLFQTADELIERIRCQPAGVYTVQRQLPPQQGSGRETAFWGDVAHFGAGRVSFGPSPPDHGPPWSERL